MPILNSKFYLNKTCIVCKERFHGNSSETKCDKCKTQPKRSRTNQKAVYITKKCAYCGKDKTFYIYRMGKFCNKECANKFIKEVGYDNKISQQNR